MQITSLTVGSLGTNCYILYDETAKDAVVVDPSDEAELVAARIRDLGLKVRAILLTHAHFDHAGDADRIRDLTGAPVYLHPADLGLPSWLTHGISADRDLAEGEELVFGSLKLQVLLTPGHTPGSVCFLCGARLIAGDTLFAGSCGRVDLPGGSWDEMLRSLRRLAGLEGNYTVYPGHGEFTTLDEERKFNPYMKQALRTPNP